MSNDTHDSGKGDQLLAHDYDGIREYDNPTPGWWHAVFFASVVFAVVYWAVFHMSPLGEKWGVHGRYETAAKNAEASKLAQLGTLAEDRDTLVRLSGSEAALARGKAIFANCTPCHGSNAGGIPGLGLNLTDDYAKNYKEPEEVFNTIAHGVAGTAMPPWLDQIGKDNCILAAAYVISLRGTNVEGGQPPTGDPLPEWPKPSAGN